MNADGSGVTRAHQQPGARLLARLVARWHEDRLRPRATAIRDVHLMSVIWVMNADGSARPTSQQSGGDLPTRLVTRRHEDRFL